MEIEKVSVINGDLFTDTRGVVRFVNGFDPYECGIRRMYVLENHKVGFVRAWHGHLKEAKYTTVMNGVAKIGVARIEGNELIDPEFFILDSAHPQVLYIPPGYANGSMGIAHGTQVIHFSTVELEESKGDDFRWPWDWFDTLGGPLWN